MFSRRTAWTCLWLVSAVRNAQGQLTTCTAADVGSSCSPSQEDVLSGCATATDLGVCSLSVGNNYVCPTVLAGTDSDICDVPAGCFCSAGVCFNADVSGLCEFTTEENTADQICTPENTTRSSRSGLTAGQTNLCVGGTEICGDPHMKGLRGQKIDWSGIDGGWYSMVRDDDARLQVNLRLTAPLPEEFPDRQLITGLSVLSEGHSLVIDVTNPYDINTKGCPQGMSPCLADGGLRAVVDGDEVEGLLRFSRDEDVVDGISFSASNLPAECRQFGGDRIWARMYDEMLRGERQLAAEEAFEDWILRFDDMAAPDWCKNYIEQHNLADLQSTHAVFKIVTPTVTVRLNVGTNYQDGGDLDWDGRVLPELEFWQMDVGLHGLSLENESLSGILGETARPVLDEDGREVIEGYEAFRGTVEDYRVPGPLGTDFALLAKV